MNEQELDQALRAIGVRHVRQTAPSALRELARVAPTSVPERRRWLPFQTWRFQSMFSATKFVVAGVIVALFGGFLLGGVLTQRPSDEQGPAVTSASSSPEAPADVAPDQSLRSDILPGVDLVTEEVEPGVYRVVSDGRRDPSRTRDGDDPGGILDGNIVAGLDGSVWVFGPDGFFRLGDEGTHRWPKGRWEGDYVLASIDIEVGADGTVWLTSRSNSDFRKNAPTDALSYDGETWTRPWRGAAGKRWAFDVALQQDGTVWMAWFTQTAERRHQGRARAARLGDDDWEALPGSVKGGPGDIREALVAVGGGTDVWLLSSRPYRHDGEGWVAQETPDPGGVVRAAVGPDGTLWVRLICGPDSRCSRRSDVIARLDGEDWEVYDSSDGIPMMGDHYQGFAGFFAVAPDRSIWFNPIGDWETTGRECDGVATFDGRAVSYFLRDLCVFAMDIAPDGTVWLQAGEDRAVPGPIHTYAITPEATAATG